MSFSTVLMNGKTGDLEFLPLLAGSNVSNASICSISSDQPVQTSLS